MIARQETTLKETMKMLICIKSSISVDSKGNGAYSSVKELYGIMMNMIATYVQLKV